MNSLYNFEWFVFLGLNAALLLPQMRSSRIAYLTYHHWTAFDCSAKQIVLWCKKNPDHWNIAHIGPNPDPADWLRKVYAVLHITPYKFLTDNFAVTPPNMHCHVVIR